MNSSNSKMQYLYFMLVDMAGTLCSFFLALFIRYGLELRQQSSVYKTTVIVLVFTIICTSYLMEPYRDIVRRGYFQEYKNVIKCSLALLVILLSFLFFTKQSDEYSRMVFFYFFTLNVILTYMMRVFFKGYLVGRYRSSIESAKVMIVTTKNKAADAVRKMKEKDIWFYQVNSLAILDEDQIGAVIEGIPVNAGYKEMFESARLGVLDDVLIDMPHDYQYMKDIINSFQDMGVRIHINLQDFELKLPNERVERIGGFTVITSDANVRSQLQLLIKRVMDIFGSIVGLLITGIVSVFLAPAIKIESRGPVFFSQTRVGKNGRKFKIYKFRSMYADAEERKKELMANNKMQGNMFKMDNDPRITKVGKFIRKTSLDELPQFWNVLKGDMSLVGTRPPTVDEFEKYQIRHKKRLSIKPGITGLWQVSGRNDVTDFEKVVELDNEYIDNWNLGVDVKLILLTVWVVLTRRGAG
ncbi:sugar transferase [Diplocloster agilis]|uniref:sugar transferase n=1 Tax=Diplocloster agilis TaxID=2850323 RepID=UPI0008216EFC|nr:MULTISPECIES: sugar transferase [Lachnospiraceae]MBU9742375.1 sugar transferase [Diplocloster agilis]MCU6733083.1 sugar transferase [Suonthocola fibrivorans]SCI74881.1 Putative colanic biosynthesis UDP-glucose lipid carrier transferase [uncultured Clostridium sp.]